MIKEEITVVENFETAKKKYVEEYEILNVIYKANFEEILNAKNYMLETKESLEKKLNGL